MMRSRVLRVVKIAFPPPPHIYTTVPSPHSLLPIFTQLCLLPMVYSPYLHNCAFSPWYQRQSGWMHFFNVTSTASTKYCNHHKHVDGANNPHVTCFSTATSGTLIAALHNYWHYWHSDDPKVWPQQQSYKPNYPYLCVCFHKITFKYLC